jgi:hypothetical protein
MSPAERPHLEQTTICSTAGTQSQHFTAVPQTVVSSSRGRVEGD